MTRGPWMGTAKFSWFLAMEVAMVDGWVLCLVCGLLGRAGENESE